MPKIISFTGVLLLTMLLLAACFGGDTTNRVMLTYQDISVTLTAPEGWEREHQRTPWGMGADILPATSPDVTNHGMMVAVGTSSYDPVNSSGHLANRIATDFHWKHDSHEISVPQREKIEVADIESVRLDMTRTAPDGSEDHIVLLAMLINEEQQQYMTMQYAMPADDWDAERFDSIVRSIAVDELETPAEAAADLAALQTFERGGFTFAPPAGWQVSTDTEDAARVQIVSLTSDSWMTIKTGIPEAVIPEDTFAPIGSSSATVFREVSSGLENSNANPRRDIEDLSKHFLNDGLTMPGYPDFEIVQEHQERIEIDGIAAVRSDIVVEDSAQNEYQGVVVVALLDAEEVSHGNENMVSFEVYAPVADWNEAQVNAVLDSLTFADWLTSGALPTEPGTPVPATAGALAPDTAEAARLLAVSSEPQSRQLFWASDGEGLLTTDAGGWTFYNADDLTTHASGTPEQGWYEQAAFHPDTMLLALRLGEGGIELWDVEQSERLLTLEGPETHLNFMNTLSMSADGTRLASGSPASGASENTIQVWDIPGGEPVGELLEGDSIDELLKDDLVDEGLEGEPVDELLEGDSIDDQFVSVDLLEYVVLSPDGSRLAYAINGEENVVVLWDVEQQEEIARYSEAILARSAQVFSPDGRLLAVAGAWDNIVSLYDTNSGKEVSTLESDSWSTVTDMAFSPEGATLVVLRDNTVELWDVETGSRQQSWITDTWDMSQATLSPDGRLLAIAASTRVELWDVENGRLLRTLRGHRSPVTGMAFSPDSRLLATGAPGEVVRLWGVPQSIE